MWESGNCELSALPSPVDTPLPGVLTPKYAPISPLKGADLATILPRAMKNLKGTHGGGAGGGVLSLH